MPNHSENSRRRRKVFRILESSKILFSSGPWTTYVSTREGVRGVRKPDSSTFCIVYEQWKHLTEGREGVRPPDIGFSRNFHMLSLRRRWCFSRTSFWGTGSRFIYLEWYTKCKFKSVFETCPVAHITRFARKFESRMTYYKNCVVLRVCRITDSFVSFFITFHSCISCFSHLLFDVPLEKVMKPSRLHEDTNRNVLV